MLLKDLKIEFENFTIRMEAEVIIKRDGKHYAVPIIMHYTHPGKKVTYHGFIKENIEHFMATAEKVSKEWIVDPIRVSNEVGHGSGKKLMEKEIEL